MNYTVGWLVVFLAFLWALTGVTYAQVQTITVTHTYVMGDNDSRNDARQLCFLEAKRKVLEKAGTFIESSSEIKSFQLTKDQISSYSAAILSVETVKENFSSSNGQNTITLTVKADIDTGDVRKRLAAITNDNALQQRIDEQQKKLRLLENNIERLSSQIAKTPISYATDLRKERNVVFSDITELEKTLFVAKQRIDEETDREREIAGKMKRYVLVGMVKSEVESILGPPFRTGYSGTVWYYGDSSVFFSEYKEGDYRVSTVFPSFKYTMGKPKH